MTSPRRSSGPGAAWSPLLMSTILWGLLAGCAGPDTHNRAAQADVDQCRDLVNAAYERQNRADLYRSDQRDSPFSSSGTPGVTSAGLSTQYDYNQQMRSCVRGSTANIAGSNKVGSEPVATPTITVVPSGR